MPYLLYNANDNILRLHGAHTTDLTTGDPLYLTSTATVQVTLADLATGMSVSGTTWPKAMSYIAGSRGDFLVNLPNEMVLTDGQALRARVTLDNGTDQYGLIDAEVQVVPRRV